MRCLSRGSLARAPLSDRAAESALRAYLEEADQLLFDQFEETWATDEDLAVRARENTYENFRLVFDREFISGARIQPRALSG